MKAELEIRRALPGDTPRMWAITRDVWNGSDYLPFVWQKWLDDARGTVLAATRSGVLVGLQHIDVQHDGTAWIEGIRVDPDAQGLGIGFELLSAGIAWAAAAGCGRVRLCTSSENPSSNRIALKAGLTLVGRYPTLRAIACSEPPPLDTVRVAGVTEFEQILHLLATRRLGASEEWMYSEGWTVRTLTRDRLRMLLGTHAVIVSGNSNLEAIGVATCTPDRHVLRLGMLEGTPDAVQRLAYWLRFRAAQIGVPALRATAISSVSVHHDLQRAGFTSTDGHSMLLYEFPLRTQSARARSVLQNASSSQGSPSA